MDWRPNVPIRGVLSQSPPALASYDGLLHLVYRGDSNNLFHISFDGHAWAEAAAKIEANPGQPDPRTQSAPALASYDGLLHLVYRGASNNLFHISFDGHAWARAAAKIEANPGQPDPRTQSAPALASHDGLLHLVYRGDSNNLFHISFDGHAWARAAAKIEANPGQPDPRTQSAPALASYDDGLLHLVYRGASNNLFHISFDGHAWARAAAKIEANPGQPDPRTQSAPALASHDGLLHLVHQGNDSNSLWHSAFNGHLWTAAGLSSTNRTSTVEIIIPGQASKAPPALASYGDMLRMAHLDGDSNVIWYSYLDPIYDHPTCQIWADPPTVIGEPGSPEHAIHAIGHRLCRGTDPQAVRLIVRIKTDNGIWFDGTMAEKDGFGVTFDVGVEYICTGRGSETVYTEVELDDGQTAESARVDVPLCS